MALTKKDLEKIEELFQKNNEMLFEKLATKEEIAKLATKEEIAKLATKEEIAKLATKEEVANLSTKIGRIRKDTKKDITKLFNEIVSVRKEAKEERVKLSKEIRSFREDTKAEISKLATKKEISKLVTKKEFKKQNKEFLEMFAAMFGELATKDEVRDIVGEELLPLNDKLTQLQDDVFGIKNELKTEHEFRLQHIEGNTVRIEKLEKRFANDNLDKI